MKRVLPNHRDAMEAVIVFGIGEHLDQRFHRSELINEGGVIIHGEI